jgi:hypothetical protein
MYSFDSVRKVPRKSKPKNEACGSCPSKRWRHADLSTAMADPALDPLSPSEASDRIRTLWRRETLPDPADAIRAANDELHRQRLKTASKRAWSRAATGLVRPTRPA